ncbi:MAG: VanZ family protein [Methylothermaceae bacterium]|nr:VanZ family protein [Methylothermaceae bacterium]
MHAPALERRRLLLLFLLYLGFVVYGSLIPFELRPLTLDQAIARFHNIAYLKLGAASRADWIANIVLYVPLAFLCCGALLGLRQTHRESAAILVFVFAFSIALAVAVEFTQQFFAPRTVSLNDLLAETLGTAAGIGLWLFGRRHIVWLLDSFTRGGRESVQAAAITYAFFYFILALFPYDFVVSGDELLSKLASANVGWVIAPACGGIHCVARLIGELVAIAPLGLLLILIRPYFAYRQLFFIGLGFGLGLEILQIFLISGTAQGASALMRGIGLFSGGMTGQLLLRWGVDTMAHLLRRTIPLLALPYIPTLVAINGWFTSSWLSLSQGLAKIADLRFIPFYYHYFTSEPTAMASLLANAAMYAPIGVALWAWRRSSRLPDRGGTKPAALAAAGLALPLEMGKLWLEGRHPDLSNLLIAAASATISYSLSAWLGRITSGNTRPTVVETKPSAPPYARTIQLPSATAIFFGAVVLVVAIVGFWLSPLSMAWFVGLLSYALILWRYPLAWLFAIPALLPTLDFASNHGRFYLDEFDLVVLVTLAVIPLLLGGFPLRPWPNVFLKTAYVLLWLSWIFATYHGLKTAIKTPTLPSSHSPFMAWQVGKGLLWALLLVALLRRIPETDLPRARSLACYGLLTSLAIVVGVVWWERYLFVGLINFESVFRVTGTFSIMQTGGAYIEAFLAFAFPFLMVWVLTQPHWLAQLAGIVLGGMTGYAMLVTFSRGGYAGMAVGLLTVVIGTAWRHAGKSRRWIAPAILGMIMAAVAVPIVGEGFARYRLARSAEDLDTRLRHWRQALALTDQSWLAQLTGTGFGRYPTHYLLYADYNEPPGGYVIRDEEGNRYLHLLPGESVYLDQQVPVAPFTRYRLNARVRVQHPGDGLTVPICEKALLYSFQCQWFKLTPDSPTDTWKRMEISLNSGSLGSGGPWPHRPVKLSLYNAGDRPIDVDDVSLSDFAGHQLVANGGFQQGTDHWLFVTDRHLGWHIDQGGVEVYFSQGWLGLIALALFLYGAIKKPIQDWRHGQPWALAWIGGIAGFLTVSMMGSTMDEARSSMLFYFLAFCAIFLSCFSTSKTN